jgi:hypothetical protein
MRLSHANEAGRLRSEAGRARIGVMRILFALMLGLCALGLAMPMRAAEGPAAMGGALLQKHLAKGLNCNGCHQENPPATPVKINQCLTCHGTYGQLADKTEGKGEANPHGSHQGDLACDSCHHVHKPSVNYCSQCHQFEFRVP